MMTFDRYLEEVLHNVLASPEDRERLEADLRAHFTQAEAKGEPVDQILRALGAPEEVAAAFNAERGIQYAGFWQRFTAFVGDCGLLVGLALPVLGVAVLVNGPPTAAPSIGWTVFLAALCLALVGLFIFYFPLLEARFGKTLGKHLLRIRVVRENGAPIRLGQAFVRRLSLYFEVLVFDSLLIPFTEKRQRALDIVAKTIVAREPGASPSWWGWAVCLLLPLGSILALVGLIYICAPA